MALPPHISETVNLYWTHSSSVCNNMRFVLVYSFVILFMFTTRGTCNDSLKFQDYEHGEYDQLIVEYAVSSFKFASYYSDHMVLQKAPLRSKVWGYANLQDIGQQVSLTLSGQGQESTYKSTIHKGPFTDKAVWSVQLSPVSAGGPYTITATIVSSGDTVTLGDILFGDVWICSGQSNMQFTTAQMFNASWELAHASSYPDIRLMVASEVTSDVPLFDLAKIELPWSLPSKDTVGHGAWTYFSAVCWLYGRRIFEKLKYPIGLIESDWGGTPIEAWSSPEALASCGVQWKKSLTPVIYERNIHWARYMEQVQFPHSHSVLWNAMIHPLINLTVYGAIWYQGESNVHPPTVNTYNCTFPAMISDWRSKFTGDSSVKQAFPFGFVQLAGYRNNSHIDTGFPDIRWHQTADFGYVPNPVLPNVFMAVAMDLPDFRSPYGPIHPRYKEDVGSRLALSGLTVAYKMKLGQFQGPWPSAYFIDIGYHTLKIEFDSGSKPIQVRSKNGFEVCCSSDNQTYCDLAGTKWVEVLILSYSSTSVTLSYQECSGMYIVGLRYAWRESPCDFKQCAVYSVDNQLPMAPFLTNGLFGYNVKGHFEA